MQSTWAGWIDEHAAHLSPSGTGQTDLLPGDVWLLAWDGEQLDCGMIAAVKDGYVLMWPVSHPDEAGHMPGIKTYSTTLGADLTVWPTRETGIGFHLLDRCLGSVMAERTIRELDAALADGVEPPLPWATGQRSAAFDQDMVDHWARLCFHTEDRNKETPVLVQEQMRQVGISAKDAFNAIGGDQAGFIAMWRGEVAPSSEALKRLSEAFGVEAGALTGTQLKESYYVELARPEYKSSVCTIAARTNRDEASVRHEAVQSAYALAARDDTRNRERRTLGDALDRMLAATENRDD